MKIDIYILINYIIEKYIMYRSKNVVYLDVRCNYCSDTTIQYFMYNKMYDILLFRKIFRKKIRQEKSC